jgi:hypothetical protein
MQKVFKHLRDESTVTGTLNTEGYMMTSTYDRIDIRFFIDGRDIGFIISGETLNYIILQPQVAPTTWVGGRVTPLNVVEWIAWCYNAVSAANKAKQGGSPFTDGYKQNTTGRRGNKDQWGGAFDDMFNGASGFNERQHTDGSNFFEQFWAEQRAKGKHGSFDDFAKDFDEMFGTGRKRPHEWGNTDDRKKQEERAEQERKQRQKEAEQAREDGKRAWERFQQHFGGQQGGYGNSGSYGSGGEYNRQQAPPKPGNDSDFFKSRNNPTPRSVFAAEINVSVSAGKDAIKAAYKTMVKEWHPDRNAHRLEEAKTKMARINQAYEQLMKQFV